MRKVLYSGVIIACLVAVSAPAIAKGKPNKQGGPQRVEQTLQQGGAVQQRIVVCPNQPSAFDLQDSVDQVMTQNRSNKGGKVRGLDRARQVQAMNKLRKGGATQNQQTVVIGPAVSESNCVQGIQGLPQTTNPSSSATPQPQIQIENSQN